MMESTHQKTFRPKRTVLPVAAVLTFILLIYPALSAYGQYKVIPVTDGYMIKVVNIGTAATIRLVGIDAPETSIEKIELGQPFSQHFTKNLAKLVLNKSVEKNVTAMVNVAELLFWGFAAGFSERFVPQIIKKAVAKATDQTNSQDS